MGRKVALGRSTAQDPQIQSEYISAFLLNFCHGADPDLLQMIADKAKNQLHGAKDRCSRTISLLNNRGHSVGIEQAVPSFGKWMTEMGAGTN